MALAFGAGGVWFACVNASFSSSRTTLYALGPRVAVVRGALLGLVATTALGVWLPSLSFGIGTSLAVAAVILLLVSGLGDRRRPARSRRPHGSWSSGRATRAPS